MAETAGNRYEEPTSEVAAASAVADQPDPTTLDKLTTHFGKKVLGTSTRLGEATAIVDAKALVEVMTWLRDEGKFVLLSDLTAHDCHGQEPRFWVIYQLTNIETPERLRIKVGLPEKKPSVESMVPLWPGANFLEREVYDLMGIEFKNHPNLTRIMMPTEWEGHPLRKDYPVVYEPVQFTHNAAEIRARKPLAEK
ncbi:MAG: NADH-quinone oxidoreductase subunit C [Ardenticatenales bacterium]|nr:NADH-quinone oxidoreductase subunit C [Ardenticatenales bacterium]